jgi:dTDP-4-dehydrorhamnose reductase
MASEPARLQILLLGKDGQLGRSLQPVLSRLGAVRAVGRGECDLEQPGQIRALVRSTRPDIVVNAAAYTAVDKAEDDVERAFAINARAPGILAEEVATLGAQLIHFSTDYVFDGDAARPYTEEDIPRPLSVYGKSKLAGEEAVHLACPRHFILRTSWVFAAHGQNFLKTMLRLAKERKSLRVVSDQFGTPTSVDLISAITACLIERSQSSKPAAHGTYHLTASGTTSWHEYARLIVSHARAGGAQLSVEPKNVEPIPSSEYPTPARRPLSSRLDTCKLRSALDLELPAWQAGVQTALNTILSENNNGT